MLKILFHNNDALLLQNFQKEFIFLNQTNQNILYQTLPLHPTLCSKEFTIEKIKTVSKQIDTLLLKKVFWDEETQTLFATLYVNYKTNKQKTLTFPLVQTLQTQKKIAENQIKFPAISLFPKVIKTFRLGNEVIFNNGSSSLTCFCWH